MVWSFVLTEDNKTLLFKNVATYDVEDKIIFLYNDLGKIVGGVTIKNVKFFNISEEEGV